MHEIHRYSVAQMEGRCIVRGYNLGVGRLAYLVPGQMANSHLTGKSGSVPVSERQADIRKAVS